jgi:hypothetical protein
MKTLILKGVNVLLVVVISTVLASFGISEGWAQQKCKQSGKDLAEDTKYTQQHVIDVGDVPGHQIRILEIHRTPSNAKPNCEGLKVVESWARGYSDYTDLNGQAWGYGIAILENGDKIFSQWSGTSQTIVNPDGSKKSTYTGVFTYTGGTGKYQGIRGIGRQTYIFDSKAGYNEGQWEEEYWIEK